MREIPSGLQWNSAITLSKETHRNMHVESPLKRSLICEEVATATNSTTVLWWQKADAWVKVKYSLYYQCFMLVGARGFEPPTLCSQSRCATRLRHAPTLFDCSADLSNARLHEPDSGQSYRQPAVVKWAPVGSEIKRYRSRVCGSIFWKNTSTYSVSLLVAASPVVDLP